MPKTKIVRKDAYRRLLKAKGFCTEPQKGILLLYFDSISPSNAKRSKTKTFLRLVSLTFRLSTVFYSFEKMTVISLCWLFMKKWDLCKCFSAFNNFSNKNYCNLFCEINSRLQNSKATMQWFPQCNGFPQINILFSFFSSQPQTIYYNGWLHIVK